MSHSRERERENVDCKVNHSLFSAFLLYLSRNSIVNKNTQSLSMKWEHKMKYYRRWQLLTRQRRRHQPIFTCLTFGFILLLILAIISHIGIGTHPKAIEEFSAPPLQLKSSCHCSRSSINYKANGECFFDQIVCYPGYTGHQCDVPVKNEVRLNQLLKRIYHCSQYRVNRFLNRSLRESMWYHRKNHW